MGYERFIFWVWESPTTCWHACMQKKKKKKTVHFLLICIYFYIICSTNNFSKPLLCMKLICSDWSILFKAEFVSVAVFVSVTAYSICVQRYQGNSYLLTIQKLHLVANNTFAFSLRPMWKSSFPRSALHNKWAGNMQLFHVDVNMKQFGIHFKNDSFKWFRVDSFFWDNSFIHGALSD